MKSMPNLVQLQQVIASGNDSINNRLILNLNGDFELYPFETSRDDYNFQNLNYITRWDTFDSGNDYVGKNASNDLSFLNKLMEWANEAWDLHNKNGNVKILNPSI